ncbi:NAD(P)-dependent oxidoreductase [Neobacillus niacini]|uniref:NAD(P)-dependent oxidoreductase n=1 Tax=Neobacillus niacini TaxID=86668 RepID=UPI0030001264
MKKIGFLGLGAMGLPMTKNILKAGYDTYVLSRSRPPIEEAISYGAIEVSSPKELIETVDILCTCLPVPHTIIQVYEGSNGIIEGISEGKIVIEHSTINPELSKRISDQITARGGEFIEAPISGGSIGATQGMLTIMCGGKKMVFRDCFNLLKVNGENLLYVGPIGSASTYKLINNMLFIANFTALSEAYRLGKNAGINLQLLFDIIRRSTGYSKALDWVLEKEDNMERVFSLLENELFLKDKRLVTDMANNLNVSLMIQNTHSNAT